MSTPPDDLTEQEWTLLRAMWPLTSSPAVCSLSNLTFDARFLASGLEGTYLSRVSDGYVLTTRGHECFMLYGPGVGKPLGLLK